MKFSTTAIHAGYHSDPTTRAAAVPVYQTTSYTFDDSQHGADCSTWPWPATSTRA